MPCALGIGQSLVSPDSSPELTLTLLLLNKRLRLLSVQTDEEDLMPASICEALDDWRGAFYAEEKAKFDQAVVDAAGAALLTLEQQPSPSRGRTSTRRKRQVKEPADDQEGSSDEEEAGWSEALEVANTKISKLQSDAKAKKSKLTAANQLVQTKATQLNEAQTRADEAEQKNTTVVVERSGKPFQRTKFAP